MKKIPAIIFLVLTLIVINANHVFGQTTLFTDGWKFHKGDIQEGQLATTDDMTWRNVDLPHDWSIEGPFSKEWASGTGFLPGGIGWYKKTFDLATVPGEKVFIYFDGVYKNSEVWLNGHYLGKRPNGYIPFQYEITPYLKKIKNVVTVKVDHTKFADSRWYPGSGIYRNVYLVVKKPVYIPTWAVSFITPQVTEQKAYAETGVTVKNTLASRAAIKVEGRLRKGTQIVATDFKNITLAGNSESNTRLAFTLEHPKLWSTDDPSLYTLNVSIYRDGKLMDVYQKQVGFRNIRFDAGEGFFLNGKNMKMKGVCIHHDAGALGAAVPREVWQRRLRILKETGCNAIRMSHYPHQDYLYELCDELGFLVMDEAFDEWEIGKNKWIEGWNQGTPGKDGYHENFQEWAERDLRDMVLRNRNHPSIIMWSIGNEIDYPNDPYSHEILSTGRNPQIYGRGYLPDHPPASHLTAISKRLADIVRQADSTRPVTAALAGVVMSNTTGYPDNIDLVGYNYQEYRYQEDHQKYPGRIIYGSENSRNADTWIAVDTSKNIFGQFLWTGYDFMGEARAWPARSSGAGLIDLAGFPKTDYYLRQTLWTDKPVIYLTTGKITEGQPQRGRAAGKPSWNWEKGDQLRVNCITNTEEAELFLNGKSLGRKSRPDSTGAGISWNLDYEAGELLVKGFNAGKEVRAFRLTSTGPATAILATTDKKKFTINKKDLAHIEIAITDKNGNPVYEASNEVTITIEGPAKLLAIESGDLTSHEDYRSNKRKAFNGRLLAYVQSTGKAGAVRIRISSPGLKEITVMVN